MSSARSTKISTKRQKSGKSRVPHKNSSRPPASTSRAPTGTGDGVLYYALLFVAFFVACLVAYGPALTGAFISDDEHYVLNNAFIHNLTYDNIVAIFDPTGTPAKLVENYAPVHLLLNGIEWHFFGRETMGYHVVNVALHALASVLLVVVFRATAIARIPAALGGAFFLLHPANVEAVAWISQLKTPAAMVLSLLALASQRTRPVIAALLFALALFAKPTAAVALFVLAIAAWQARSNTLHGRPAGVLGSHWSWVALWAAVLVVFAVAEFWAFNQTAGQAPVLYEDTIVRWRTVCAVALRYLVMAVSSFGISVFHEPPAADSWFDPWWVGSLFALGLLAWRTFLALASGRSEGLYWVWAIVSFAPVCGIIPLPFPMADRYLYFILPGLIGGVLLFGRDHLDDLLAKFEASDSKALTSRVLIAAAIVWIAVFAVRVNTRAQVWRTGYSMMADAEAHYPQGMAAQTRIARRLALAGDAEGTVRALRAARARGYNRLDHLISDPGYNAIRGHRLFTELVNELAQEWVDRFERVEEPDQHEYRVMAQAYIVLDDLDAAIRKIEAALKIKGPITESLEDDLDGLKRKKRIRESTRKN